MKKKIIFFDGDGTLWYPESTERRVKPWWIYSDTNIQNDYLDHLVLDPQARELLIFLKINNIKAVILSTVPEIEMAPQQVLSEKIEKMGITGLLDDFFATGEYPEAKGEKILELMDHYGLDHSEALMVGDSYKWDYQSATRAGVQAILLDCPYHGNKHCNDSIARIDNLGQIKDFLL